MPSYELRKVLDKCFQTSFKKIRIRITNKQKEDKSKIGKLIDERTKLKKKHILDENEENALINVDYFIADACQDANRNKVTIHVPDDVVKDLKAGNKRGRYNSASPMSSPPNEKEFIRNS